MSDILIAAFDNFPEEAAIVGQLLAGDAELEFAFSL